MEGKLVEMKAAVNKSSQLLMTIKDSALKVNFFFRFNYQILLQIIVLNTQYDFKTIMLTMTLIFCFSIISFF